MKFLVFSDSHNYTNGLDFAIEKHPDIHHIIHLGDVENDVEYLEMVYGRTHAIVSVLGNNDFFSSTPLTHIIPIAGHKIFLAHGHKFSVKQTKETIKRYAKNAGCDVCLFGHTHEQFLKDEGDFLLLNPGSIGYTRQEYAVLTVEKDRVTAELFKK